MTLAQIAIRGGRNRIRRREKWPKKSWEEGEIGGKNREEGEIGSNSREKGDLLPSSPPPIIVLEMLERLNPRHGHHE